MSTRVRQPLLFTAAVVCVICCLPFTSPMAAESGPADAAKPGSAARGAPLGMVVLSHSATLDGQPALPSQTVFSGERLEIKDGAAEVLLSQGSRLSFGKDTAASFELKGEVTHAILDYGDLRFLHPGHSGELRIRSGEVSIFPMTGGDTQAEVAADNQFLTVAALEGTVRVEGQGENRQAAKGEALRFHRISESAPAAPQDAGPSATPAAGKTPSPPPPAAATGSRSIDWSCIEYCTLPSAAGTAGVIVALEIGSVGSSMTPTSPSPIWPYGLIPVGAAAGDLVCYLRGTCGGLKKPPPPPECTLTDVPGVAGAPDTLVWKTANATSANLEPGFGSEPLSGSVAAPRLSPGEKAAAYMLTVTGADGSSVVCMADVKAEAPPPPKCECLSFELVKPEGDACKDPYKLKWTSVGAVSGEITAYPVPPGQKSLQNPNTETVAPNGAGDLMQVGIGKRKDSPAKYYDFSVKCKDGTIKKCAPLSIPDPSCKLELEYEPNKQFPETSSYKVKWSDVQPPGCAKLQGYWAYPSSPQGPPTDCSNGQNGERTEGVMGTRVKQWVLTVKGPNGVEKTCVEKPEVPMCTIVTKPEWPGAWRPGQVVPTSFTLDWSTENATKVTLTAPCTAKATATKGTCKVTVTPAAKQPAEDKFIMLQVEGKNGVNKCAVVLPGIVKVP